tara:strand:+ start:203 stop:334 length:132 start_codon:yes stop_codon:yes gene_type:complete
MTELLELKVQQEQLAQADQQVIKVQQVLKDQQAALEIKVKKVK